jgi:hypothetical protein
MRNRFTLSLRRCIGAIIPLVAWAGFASAQVLTPAPFDLVADGGAVPNDGNSDHQAFKMAERYFAQNPNGGTLIIPDGTYQVGRQDGLTGEYHGNNVLTLNGNSNATIRGGSNVVIQFKNGLKFGKDAGWDGNSNNIIWSPGYFLSCNGCTNVTIQNLTVDGNSATFDFMGNSYNQGMELEHDGIFLFNTHQVAVQGVTLKRMGRDGIQAKFTDNTYTPQSAPLNLTMTNCAFDYNGRNGFSWTGGHNVTATNCTFNHSGQSRVVAGPHAGMDIEPEGGNYVSNGVFTDCQFANNARIGVETSTDSGMGDQFTFTRCTLTGQGGGAGPALIAWYPHMSFTNCTIYGALQNAYNAHDDAKAIRFTDCLFTDIPFNGQETTNGFLLNTQQSAARARFERCEFRTHSYLHSFMYIDNTGALPADYIHFVDSKFVTAYTQPLMDSGQMTTVLAAEVSFDGKCTFEKGPNQPARQLGVGPAVYHLRPPVVTGKLTLGGGPDIQYVQDGGDMVLKAGSVLTIDSRNELLLYRGSGGGGYGGLHVEEGATLIVNSGGHLSSTGPPPVHIDGTLIVRNGGFICLDYNYNQFVGLGPHARVQYDVGATQSNDPTCVPPTRNRDGTLIADNPLVVSLAQQEAVVAPNGSDYRLDFTATTTGSGALRWVSLFYPSHGRDSLSYEWKVDYGQGFQPVPNNNSDVLSLHFNTITQSDSIRVAVTVVDNHGQAYAEMRTDPNIVHFPVDSPRSIYPNPADARVEVQRPVAQQAASRDSGKQMTSRALATPAAVEVYTSTGARVYTGNLVADKLQLDTSKWPNGLYLVRIVEGKHVTTQQLRVAH